MPVQSIPGVIDVAVKASLILGVTAVAAAALRRASASARHFVWMLGLVGALAVPALSFVTPRWELPLVEVTAQPTVPATAATPATIGHLPQGRRNLTSESRNPLNSNQQVAPAFRAEIRSVSTTTMVLLVWAIGAALVLGRMLVGLLAVQWMSRRTAIVSDAPWLDEARSLAGSLGLARVRFLRSGAHSMPMAWGVFRPSVLMPADADGWPIERLRIVLLHELAHVKRHDCFTHLLAQLACAAYWFNPLAWIAARRLRTERERACDDLVLASGTRGSDYADHLLDIARAIGAGRFPAVLAGATLAMARRSQLEGRLMAILDPNVPRRSLTPVGVLAVVGLFAVLIVPVAAVQPWTSARANAAQQNVIQDDPQGRVQGAVQGGVAGGIAGGITEGVARGIAGGVRGGVQGGVEGAVRTRIGVGVGAGVGAGVATGVGIGTDIAAGITQSIVNGMANGIANGVVRELPQSDSDAAATRTPRQPDPRAVNALVEALKDTDKGVREAAMEALVQLRDPRVVEPLMTALKDSSAEIREQAAFGLGQIRDERAVDPLISALKDSKKDVREQAAFALGQICSAKAVDGLVSALKDAEAAVREQAAFALGQIRDPRAIEGLTAALKDVSASVRQQAAFALGQIR